MLRAGWPKPKWPVEIESCTPGNGDTLELMIVALFKCNGHGGGSGGGSSVSGGGGGGGGGGVTGRGLGCGLGLGGGGGARM